MAALGAVATIPGALQVAEAATPNHGGRLRVGAATNEPLTGHYEFDGRRAFERWWFA